MKKKGLIVATIVMVLVLAVSLTTATYAWFTTSSVTKLEDFTVSVTSDNAVNIGVKANNTFATYDLTTDAFFTGDVTYTKGQTDGVLGGAWTSESTGLSANINHNIEWGSQRKAVGVTNTASSTSTTINDYGTLAAKYNSGTYTINAASLDNSGNTPALTTVTAAVANNNGAAQNPTSDYVYLFLGASPTKALVHNKLCIMLDMTSSTASTVGVMASLHIAYRTCLAANKGTSSAQKTVSEWTEIDLFGSTTYAAQKSSLSSNAWAANGSALTTASQDIQDAYVATYSGTYPTASVVASIGDLSLDQGDIDQIELVIYLCGPDTDCNDSGLGASGTLKIFFQTEAASSNG